MSPTGDRRAITTAGQQIITEPYNPGDTGRDGQPVCMEKLSSSQPSHDETQTGLPAPILDELVLCLFLRKAGILWPLRQVKEYSGTCAAQWQHSDLVWPREEGHQRLSKTPYPGSTSHCVCGPGRHSSSSPGSTEIKPS